MIWKLGVLAVTVAIVAAVTFGGAGLRNVSAQDQASAAGPVIPDPKLCQVEPRTVDELTALFAAVPADADPSLPAAVALPTGPLASSAVAESVTGVVEEAIACLNGGQFLRFLALLTDDAVLTAFSWLGPELANGNAEELFAAPEPANDGEAQQLVAVADVRMVDLARVGAFLVIIDPNSGSTSPHVIHLVFAYDDERWLIDEVAEFTGE